MATTIKKNQTVKVQTLICAMINKDRARLEDVLAGGRVTDYRLSEIAKAYAEGTESQLPAIQYEPQTGYVIDGRHRLIAAWTMGVKEIKADFHYHH